MASQQELEAAFRDGAKEGIKRFAWWKDGVEYVGSCGKTLKAALKEFDTEPVVHLFTLDESRETKFDRDAAVLCPACGVPARPVHVGNTLTGYVCETCDAEVPGG